MNDRRGLIGSQAQTGSPDKAVSHRRHCLPGAIVQACPECCEWIEVTVNEDRDRFHSGGTEAPVLRFSVDIMRGLTCRAWRTAPLH